MAAPPCTEQQLAEDREKIRAFRANLDRYADITSGMVKVLSSFETRLQELDDIITPLHEITQGASLAHQNIEQTISQVESILSRFDAQNEVGPRILKGIGSDLDGYLAAVDKVRETLLFFNKNEDIGGADSAAATLRELQSRALRELEDDFKKTLAKISNAGDPTRLLTGAEGEAASAAAAADAVPSATVERLAKLVSRLEKWKKSRHLEAYAKLRGDYIHDSLLKLSPNSIATGGVDVESAEGDAPSASASFKKGRRGGKDEGAAAAAAAAGPYRRGTHRGIRLLRCFAVLLQCEATLAERLLGRRAAEEGGALAAAAEPAAGLVLGTARRVVHAAETAAGGREHLFPLLDLFEACERLRGECPALQSLPDFEEAREALARAALTLYGSVEQEVARHPSSVKDVPPDATVHELASTTLAFLRRLCEFGDAVPRLLASPFARDEAGGSRRAGRGGNGGDLASYVGGVLRALGRNIEEKAGAYRSAAQGFLFAANNQSYLAKQAAAAPLAPLLGPKTAQSFEAAAAASLKRYYEATCGAALAYVRGDVVGKEEIKAAFKGFNEALAEQERAQGRWAVPDPELRRQIRQELVAGRLLPAYRAFHAKFASVPFSKAPALYPPGPAPPPGSPASPPASSTTRAAPRAPLRARRLASAPGPAPPRPAAVTARGALAAGAAPPSASLKERNGA